MVNQNESDGAQRQRMKSRKKCQDKKQHRETEVKNQCHEKERERNRGTWRKSEGNSEWMSHLLLWIKAPGSRHCGAE